CISYNDEAGRFEFQVIENYAEGQTPKVYYANRTQCISCHLSRTPIFTDIDWLETDDNFLISTGTILANYGGDQAEVKRRKVELEQAFGDRFRLIGLHRGAGLKKEIDLERARAGRIDRSVQRASQITEFQRKWIYLCGEDEAGNSCRAQLFLMA